MTGVNGGRAPVHSPRTIVHLVRHGEVHNPSEVLYGRLPGFRLSDRGRVMAEATAKAFTDHDVAYVACSPLQRTRETCQPVTRVTGVEPVIDPDVVEAGNSFEGLHVRGWDSDLWNPRYWPRLMRPGVPSWGEPYVEIADRMFEAIDRAREAAEGREAVIVTHQLCVVAAARRARGLRLRHNPADRQCDLSSVTSLIYLGDTIVGVRYSEPAAHL